MTLSQEKAKKFKEQFQDVSFENYDNAGSFAKSLSDSPYLKGATDPFAFAVGMRFRTVRAYVDFSEAQFVLEGGCREHKAEVSKILTDFCPRLESV